MIIFFGLLAIALIFRQSLTESLVIRSMQRFNEHYQAKFTVGSFAFDGLSGLSFRNITLKPLQGDSLMRIGYFHANINISKLFGFKLALRNLEMKDVWFHFVRYDSLTNYMFLFDKGIKTADKSVQPDQPVDYADRADRLLNAMFDKIPASITINNLHIDANMNSNEFGFYVDQLAISGHEFETLIEETDHGKVTRGCCEVTLIQESAQPGSNCMLVITRLLYSLTSISAGIHISLPTRCISAYRAPASQIMFSP